MKQGRKAGDISTLAKRPETVEAQLITIDQSQKIIAKVITQIKKWEANGRSPENPKEGARMLNELESSICNHLTAKALRICARPDKENLLSQAEAASIIFKSAKTWQRWENGVIDIGVADIYFFLLASSLMTPYKG